MSIKLYSVILALPLICPLPTLALSLTYAMSSSPIQVHGHRGNPLVLPENSAEGVVSALKLGAHAAEIDVHMTSDKQIILHHDPIMSTDHCQITDDEPMTVPAIINRLDLKEIKRYKCKIPAKKLTEGRANPTTRISTLPETLIAFMNQPQWRSQKINIEIKSYTQMTKMDFPQYSANLLYPQKNELVNTVLASVQSVDFPFENVIFQSFDKEILKLLSEERQKYQYNYKLSYLYTGEYISELYNFTKKFTARCKELCWVPFWKEAKEFITYNQIDIFSPNFDLISTPGYSYFYKKVFMTKEEGPQPQVFVWTVNDEKKWDHAIKEFKVNGIITDRPQALIEYLKKQ